MFFVVFVKSSKISSDGDKGQKKFLVVSIKNGYMVTIVKHVKQMLIRRQRSSCQKISDKKD